MSEAWGIDGATKPPIAPGVYQAVGPRATPRRMRLTPELVARVARHVDDPGPTPGRALRHDADYEETTRDLLDARPAAAKSGSSHMAR